MARDKKMSDNYFGENIQEYQYPGLQNFWEGPAPKTHAPGPINLSFFFKKKCGMVTHIYVKCNGALVELQRDIENLPCYTIKVIEPGQIKKILGDPELFDGIHADDFSNGELIEPHTADYTKEGFSLTQLIFLIAFGLSAQPQSDT